MQNVRAVGQPATLFFSPGRICRIVETDRSTKDSWAGLRKCHIDDPCHFLDALLKTMGTKYAGLLDGDA